MSRRKQILSGLFILVAIGVSSLLPHAAQATPPPAFTGHGLGTATYPYQITTCAQMSEIGDFSSSYFALMTDIVMTAGPGCSYSPIPSFTGSFDGRNHVLSNLATGGSGSETGNGALFNQINGGTVANLTLSSVTLNMPGGQYTGGLAGSVSHATISHVNVDGAVTGTTDVGGLVGNAEDSTSITYSSFTGTVSATVTTGGLVGRLTDSSITNSYANSSVTASGGLSAGLVGVATSNDVQTMIADSYAAGTVNVPFPQWDGQLIASSESHNSDPDIQVYVNRTWANVALSGSGFGFIGRDTDQPTKIENSYYNSFTNTVGCITGSPATGCTAVNTDGSDANHFKTVDGVHNSNQVSPMDSYWNFTDIWQNNLNAFPSLKDNGSLPSLASLTSPSNPNWVSHVGITDHINLEWIPPSDDYLGGDRVTGYRIQYSPAGMGDWTTVDTGNTDTTYTITDLDAWSSYDVQIAAINAQGVGAYLGPDTITVVATDIYDCQQLQAIDNDPTQDYVLKNDIDCSATAHASPEDGDYDPTLYNDGEGFRPIMDFTGSLSGDNGEGGVYTISNLTINRTNIFEDPPQSLIGVAFSGANIHDLNLTGVNIIGTFDVGAVVGQANGDVAIDNVTVDGNIQGLSGVGMAVGGAYMFDGVAPTFTNITTSGTLLGFEDEEFPSSEFGGVIGYLASEGSTPETATLDDLTSSVDIVNEDSVSRSGGIVGTIDLIEGVFVNINDSVSHGNIYGDIEVGGIVGLYIGNRDGDFPEVHITDTHSDAHVDGSEDVGGLVGGMDGGFGAKLYIADSYYSTPLDEGGLTMWGVDGGGGAGGLIGGSSHISDAIIAVDRSYAMTDINDSSNDDADVGGLFGRMEVPVEVNNSYANATLLSSGNAGGIAGTAVYMTADNVYSLGYSYAPYGAAGGLFGQLYNGSVTDSFTSTNAFTDSGIAGTLIGTAPLGSEAVTVTNLWFDQYAATQSDCYYDGDTSLYIKDVADDLDSDGAKALSASCTGVNFNEEGSPSDPNYFIANKDNQPISGWNFHSNWSLTTAEDYGYPVLKSHPQYDEYSVVDPVINDCEELQNMGDGLDMAFTLANDIDCSATSNSNTEDPDFNPNLYNDGEGFQPVGDSLDSFVGSLDGQGYKITNLHIDTDRDGAVGLFGTTQGATITNLKIDNGDGVTNYGGTSVGGLIGEMYGGTIINVEVDQDVRGQQEVGGLIGTAHCTSLSGNIFINKVKFDGGVGVSSSLAGGIVGDLETVDPSCDILLTNARNLGYISWEIDDGYNIGGIVGGLLSAGGTVYIGFPSNYGQVIATSGDVGGIIGNQITDVEGGGHVPHIFQAKVDGYISSGGMNYDAGGIIGSADGGANIDESKTAGTIQGWTNVGGIVGNLQSQNSTVDIDESYSTVHIESMDGGADTGQNIGGLVGLGDQARIENSYSGVYAHFINGESVGGIAGNYQGDIVHSYAASNITGATHVGGIAGTYSGTFADEESPGIFSNFSNSHMYGADYYSRAGIVGTAVGTNAMSYNWFNGHSSAENTSVCALDEEGNQVAGAINCTSVNVTNSNPYWFRDNSTMFPFGNDPDIGNDPWDFENVWATATNSTPRLRWDYTRPVSEIHNCLQLQAMKEDLSRHYTLGEDIYCGYATGNNEGPLWNGGDGFTPVGDENSDDFFLGSLDGNGYSIHDLNIHSDSTASAGLFGITYNADINNVALIDPDISSEESPVGALVGTMYGGNMEETFVQGDITSDYDSSATGAVVGLASCQEGGQSLHIEDVASDSTVSVTDSDAYAVGGAIGMVYNNGPDCPTTVEGVANMGNVEWSGTSDDYGGWEFGGVIGEVAAQGDEINISNLVNFGNVSGAEGDAGGAIGYIYDSLDDDGAAQITVQYSGNEGDISISPGGDGAGGLVGFMGPAQISDSGSNGDVSGGQSIGGLVGYVEGNNRDNQLERVFATGSVSGLNEDEEAGRIGGLAGRAYATGIKDSYSWSDVSGIQTPIGGLAGYLDGDLVNSYASGSINSLNSDNPEVGGLIGYYNGGITGGVSLKHNFSAAQLTFTHDFNTTDVGGLVGRANENNVDFTADIADTNSFDPNLADTNTCAWGRIDVEGDMQPAPYYCDTAVYSTYQDNSSNEPFATEVDNEGEIEIVANWNFDQIWDANEEGYPTLQLAGGEYNPLISTCQDLQNMQDRLDGDYVLVNDIDCADGDTDNDSYEWNDHAGFIPIGLDDNDDFTGSLEGNGYTIDHLYIAQDEDHDAGLFYSLRDSIVSDLKINESVVSGGYNVGALAAFIDGTAINQVGVEETGLNGYQEDFSSTGGLVGYSTDSYIVESYAKVSTEAYQDVGGLVGSAYNTEIDDSYSDSWQAGTNVVGGLVGWQENGNIQRSYAAGQMYGGESVGGLVGVTLGYVGSSFAAPDMNVSDEADHHGGLFGQFDEVDGAVQESNFYDQGVTGEEFCTDGHSVCDGTAVNTPEDSNEDYFFNTTTSPPYSGDDNDWDFESIWRMRSTNYPVLQWQEPAYEIHNCDELQDIDTDLNGEYTLMNNIDCSENSFTPIGQAVDGTFTGSLWGQGYVISELGVIQEGQSDVGLFARTNHADIGDLTINGVMVGDISVGMVVGEDLGYTVLYMVSNYGDVAGNSNVGGLVGYSHNSLHIFESYNQGSTWGGTQVGGLAGLMDFAGDVSEITNAYNAGIVHGTSNVGGLAGIYAGGYLSHSFNAGLIEYDDGDSTGALVGVGGETGITDSWIDVDRTGSASANCVSNIPPYGCHNFDDPEDGENYNPNQLFGTTSAAPFTTTDDDDVTQNWDFENTWRMHTGTWPTFYGHWYDINDCNDLQQIDQDLTASYILDNDIDCSETVNWNLRPGDAPEPENFRGFEPIGADPEDYFTGTLDGNDYWITGMYQNHQEGDHFLGSGLFAQTDDAIIKNIVVNDSEFSGQYNVGALATYAHDSYLYDNQSNATVIDTTEPSSGSKAGGLIGEMDGGSAAGTPQIQRSSFTGSVYGGDRVGGLVGSAYNSFITDSFTQGTVISDSFHEGSNGSAGGLIGDTYNVAIEYSYSSADLVAPIVGGLIGQGTHQTEIAGSFAATHNLAPDLTGQVGGLMGFWQNDGDNWILLNNYYDVGRMASEMGVNSNDVDDSANTPVNVDGSQPYFLMNPDNLAFSSSANSDDWSYSDDYTRYPLLDGHQSAGPSVRTDYVERHTTSLRPNWIYDYLEGGVIRSQSVYYRVKDSGADFTKIAVPVTTQNATIANLSPNTWYEIYVIDENSGGFSDWNGFEAKTRAVTTSESESSGTPAKTTSTGSDDSSDDDTTAAAGSGDEEVTPEDTKIMLDDFPEFINVTGKQLELKVGQVVYFTVGDQEHSATIKEIGPDYVVLTLRSEPFDVKLMVGQTEQYDVTDDGQDDVEIHYNGATNGLASLTFRRLSAVEPINNKVNTTANAFNWLPLILAVVGVILLVAAMKRRANQADPKESPKKSGKRP